MNNIFANVPVEPDTKIIYQMETEFFTPAGSPTKMPSRYDIRFERWYWAMSGITAESIIFKSDDVAELSDTNLEQAVRSSPLVEKDSKMTIKRSDSGFTFVNFNFEMDGVSD